MNSTMMELLNQDRRHALAQEVRKSRGLQRTSSAEARSWEHSLAHLGQLLVSAGLRLQERYGTAGYSR
ncbi:MAG: hypothetical protein JXA37_10060 [Chloroflexia bacterium]|nr:hypothetical protein [Chloroflexia bacterium]